MRSVIFSPIAWWERHWAYAIEISHRESAKGHEVIFVHCNRALASCAANPHHLKWKCGQCTHQVRFSTKEHFPPDVKNIFISARDTKAFIEEFSEIQLDDLDSLRTFHYKGFPFGKHVSSHLISIHRNRLLPKHLIKEEGTKLLVNSIATYEAILNAIPQGSDLVFLWGGRRSSEAPMKFAAQTWKAEIQFFEEGSELDKLFLTNFDTVNFRQAYLDITAWEQTRRQALEVPLMLNSGHEYFSDRRSGQSREPNFNWFMRYSQPAKRLPHQNKPILTIFTSSDWEFAEYDSNKSEGFFETFWDQYSLLHQLLQDLDLFRDYYVIVRWHPNHRIAGEEEKARIRDVITENSHVKHFEFNDPTNSYDLISESSLVIVFGSTIGIESASSGVPTILLGDATYSGLGAVYEPNNLSELRELLRSDLKSLPTYWALVWADWSKHRGERLQHIRFLNNSFYLGKKRVLKLKTSVKSRYLISELLNLSVLILNKIFRNNSKID